MPRLQIIIDIKEGEEFFLLSGQSHEMLKQELKSVLAEYRLGFNKYQKMQVKSTEPIRANQHHKLTNHAPKKSSHTQPQKSHSLLRICS